MKIRRKPRFWVLARFIFLALLFALVLWIVVAPRAIRLVRPDDSGGKPNLSEVESGMRRSFARQGAIKDVRCHSASKNIWSCTVFFADGHVDLTKAVWYQRQRALGLSVVRRIAP